MQERFSLVVVVGTDRRVTADQIVAPASAERVVRSSAGGSVVTKPCTTNQPLPVCRYGTRRQAAELASCGAAVSTPRVRRVFLYIRRCPRRTAQAQHTGTPLSIAVGRRRRGAPPAPAKRGTSSGLRHSAARKKRRFDKRARRRRKGHASLDHSLARCQQSRTRR